MAEQIDDVQLGYFVLCDHVITEALTEKQSLIGIYSALAPQRLPFIVNLAVAICLRVRSDRERKLVLQVHDPDKQLIFTSPPLPCDWSRVRTGLQTTGFATAQIAVNLQEMPIYKVGTYLTSLHCDDVELATYPLAVFPAAATTNEVSQ